MLSIRYFGTVLARKGGFMPRITRRLLPAFVLVSIAEFRAGQTSAAFCRRRTEPCTNNRQCCSNYCYRDRFCSCLGNKSICSWDMECCSGRCRNGECHGKNWRR